MRDLVGIPTRVQLNIWKKETNPTKGTLRLMTLDVYTKHWLVVFYLIVCIYSAIRFYLEQEELKED